LLLTAVLGAACLNENISAFLIVIPGVDIIRRRGLNLWVLAAHSLVIPVAKFQLLRTILRAARPGACSGSMPG
jgi:hypothetical protein